MNPTTNEAFWWFVRERETIRWAKQRGFAFPWTDDDRLRRYRFPNIRRLADPGTAWLHDRLLPELPDPEQICWAILLHRLFGKPETTTLLWPMLLGGYSERWLLQLVGGLQGIFNGVLLPGAERARHLDDVLAACNTVETLGGLWVFLRGASMQEATATIRSLPGVGPELAYEMAYDLRHSLLEGAPDAQKWALPSRSAVEVSGAFLGREMSNTREQDRADTLGLMRALYKESRSEFPTWEMSEIQRALTMFHFWLREEHPPRRYKCK